MTMDNNAIERICQNAVRMALQQDREERDRQSKLVTEAAVTAALANQTSQVQALRRPDLPPFDPQNIDVWIKRIEFAYTRSNITAVKDKFAFLEKLFHAKDDARVNAFLWGDHTPEKWEGFLEYLRERYGRTRKQEVYSLLGGVPREGRRPTVLADHIRELTQNVTVDDIRKEVLLKELPAEVRQHLSSTIDDLDFDATAKAADKYFDKQGKLRESSAPASVNHVASSRPPQQQQQQQQQQQSTTSFTTAFAADDDDTDVNAVRFRQGQRQQFNVSNGSSTRGRSSSSFNRNAGANSNSFNRNSSSSRPAATTGSNIGSNPSTNKKVCRFHIKFGEQAERCEGPWCILKDKVAPKGQASH